MSREQKLALVLGFALVLIVGVLVSDHLSDANNAHVEQVIASPTSPTFGRGDAVDPISPRLIEGAPLAQADEPTTIERFANNVHDAVRDRVDAIRDNPPLPAYATRPVPVFEMSLGPKPAGQPKPGRAYTIRANDYLWLIANREYGEPQLYQALAAYNDIDVDTQLQVGSTLVLPTIDLLQGNVPAQAPMTPAPRTAPDTKNAKTRTYTIAKNDTLSEVVQRELGTIKRMKEVLALNPKLDPDSVRVGDEIILPAK